MKTVSLLVIPGHPRSRAICDAADKGLREAGYLVRKKSSLIYAAPECDLAVFYGLSGKLTKAFNDYQKRKALVFLDLGYFDRVSGGRRLGYHKVAVNARHPTDYFQRRRHDSSRLDRLGIKLAPWRADTSSGHILVAGMAPKACAAACIPTNAWETETIAKLRKITRRRIVYRPKPNWANAKALQGADFSPPGKRSLLDDLRGAHCIVSHNSNANVEALVAGIPSFTVAGAALPMSQTDLTLIESPCMDVDREQWLRDLTYTQWNVPELCTKEPWMHLANEGLIPR